VQSVLRLIMRINRSSESVTSKHPQLMVSHEHRGGGNSIARICYQKTTSENMASQED
jgi:hypothetical protein